MSIFMLIVQNPHYYILISTIAALLSISYILCVWVKKDEFGEEKFETFFVWPVISFCIFNFAFAVVIGFYYGVCWIFFGLQGIGQQQKVIFEQLLYFFSFKFLVVELVLQTSLLSVGRWIVWFVILAVAKGLLHHGQIRVTTLANSSASWKSYVWPSGHMLMVLVLFLSLIYFKRRWASNFYSDIALLLAYDVFTLAVEFLHSIGIYILHGIDAAGLQSTSDMVFLLDACADILLKASSLTHFLHVGGINGTSLSMVGVVVFLNIQSNLVQLVKKALEVYKYMNITKSIDRLFNTVEVTAVHTKDNDSVSKDEICPICIQPLANIAKQLPCGHLLHSDCLKQLMRSHPLYSLSGLVNSYQNVSNVAVDPSMLNYSAMSFKCPLCRCNISASTGELLPHVHPKDFPNMDDSASIVTSDITQSPSANSPNSTFAESLIWGLGNIQSNLRHRMSRSRAGADVSISHLNDSELRGLMAARRQSHLRTPQSNDSTTEDPFHQELENLSQLFPHIPRDMIARELLRTGSQEITADNILSGRIQIFRSEPVSLDPH